MKNDEMIQIFKMLINKDLCEDIFKDSIAKYASMD
jgi:hypothetical protein